MTTWVSYRDFERGLSGLGLWDLVCDALEGGWVETRSRTVPPPTGNPLLDDAANPTPGWWQDWLEADLPPSAQPAAWTDWLLNEVEVNWDQVLALATTLANEKRESEDARKEAQRSSNDRKLEVRKILSTDDLDELPRRELVPTDRAGPGRPSSMHLIEPMMEERAKAGRLEKTLTAEATELLRLFSENPAYATLRRPTQRTIMNQLRARYRELTGGTK